MLTGYLPVDIGIGCHPHRVGRRG